MSRLNNLKTNYYELLRMMILNSRIENHLNLEKSYRNVKAGFAGEEKVIRYLNEVHLSEKIQVFTNVLLDGAQMDVVIISPRFICILEVKNMTGEFYFDSDNKQFYRTKNGTKEGMRNPELQLQRAVRVLQSRLNRKEVYVPVQGLIILASRAGIVIQAPTLFKAIPIDAMCDFLEQMERKSKHIMTNEEMKKARHILKRNIFEIHDQQIFERHGVCETSIRRGVRCTKCFQISMVRVYSNWLCKRCSHRDRQAHITSLQEYQLLYGQKVTTEQLKWWLGIEDKYLIKRIVKEVCEKINGSSRNRTYHLDFKPSLLEPFLESEMNKN